MFDFLMKIDEALRTRRPILKDFEIHQTNCFRLFNGSLEGITGFVVEKYSDILVFQWHEGKCNLSLPQMNSIAEFYAEKLKIQSVYLKRFISDRSTQSADSQYYVNKPLWGKESPSAIHCLENGMKLEIHPYDGFSTGLFLDQRSNRDFLRSSFTGKEVLNCFSYTCAFSVACGLNQNRVTSVDLSKKYLEWGKRNFTLNGLSPQEHSFYCMDVLDYLKKTKKKGTTFDLIILDPPSFSRNARGGSFSVKKDMGMLVAESSDLLRPHGMLFTSSNLSLWNSYLLKKEVLKGIENKGFSIEWIELPESPKDVSTVENPLSVCCFRRN